jgi:signal transduction histidine kinase
MNSKKDLVGLLIHDLRGPLAVVSASASALLNKAERYGPLTVNQHRVLERILRNAHRAQVFIEDMIEIYRAEENLFHRDLFPVSAPLRESLLEALEMVAPQSLENLCFENQKEVEALFESEGISVEIRGRYCDSPFCHDRKKLQQILRNLISNGLKYRRERIRIDVAGEEDLLISVEDDGCGIAPEDREIVFKRFVRLENEKKGEVPGIGLGLSGVKLLVETMGGEIRVESAPGTGARFTIRIPPLQTPRGKGNHG